MLHAEHIETRNGGDAFSPKFYQKFHFGMNLNLNAREFQGIDETFRSLKNVSLNTYETFLKQ